MNWTKTDQMSWLMIIGIVLLLLEISFHGTGPLFLLALAAGAIYVGRKKYASKIGKLLFWGGLICFSITLLNTLAFKFLLFAVLIYAAIRFAQSKQAPSYIEPVIHENPTVASDGPTIKRTPFLKNTIYGRQTTSDQVYEWQDVNIQCGIGDTVIDLANTVLPKGESVIVIRSFIGNVKILVPYEMDVSVSHSVIAGTGSVLGYNEPKMVNQTVSFQTEGYDRAQQKVKIITSMIVGDLEVKRS
ncbi:cell wall-active antibiotics response protein LiaF [Pseudalkalibacillus berkeleyi]|uniref:Cell wall-active antibiotics response protein LiaF n=1 Tax=Pseudalkalibacillus berkeleyi TaxID=1069813 RepID=A0ABS9H5T2_9BACL|nr:cell wall-active antibiotics response protein LiaF [Pseudalkalibacillus berkeleyi]MCF6139233.1 cell wall-active antibiotics response protein LiaF [Pseudalkalibacillus berkeleyi]